MASLIRTHAALLIAGILSFAVMGAGQSLYGPALPAFAREFGLTVGQAGWLVSALWIGSAAGVALMFFGALLMLRSWGRMRDGVAVTPADPDTQTPSAQRRTALVLALCVGFTGGLVGRGLPFWAAAALFITVAIGVLHPKTELSVSRVLIKALLIGVIAGWVITLVFQEFFLVRLP